MAWGALSLPVLLAAGAAMAAKTIITTNNMSFGRFVAAGGGAISLGADGTRSRSGTLILLPSASSPAGFNVLGRDNKVTILTLPSNGSVFLTSGANRMPLNQFVSNLPPGGVLQAGAQAVTVGASLQVAPNQARGSYSGAFQVIVEYQ
jgi:hypothetical protein